MSKLVINTGSSPNDGTGDSLLAGAVKINSNFSEVYSTFGNGTSLESYVNIAGIATNVIGGIGSITQLSVSGVSTFLGTIELGNATDTTLSRASAGRIAVEGVNVVTISSTDTLTNKTLTSPTLTTPVLGTPSSGTLTNCTGLPITGITSSTTIGLGLGSIELGHVTDTTITRVSAGRIAVEGVNVVTISSTDTLTNKTLTSPTLTTPVLGTPSSGTLTNCTGLPVSGITASTTTALGVGSIELGHATDTSITRVSAGVVAIEGVNIVTTSSTDTLTNKTLTSPTLTTPVLGTPSSGTLTNCTGLPVSGITASTTTALGVGSIELGHATDTSITRVSAGRIAVEGVNVVTTSSTDTLTNKTISFTNNTLSFTSAELATACSNETGSGSLVFATSPTLVTPVLGSATATSVVVGTAVTLNSTGVNVTGIVTATSFSGSGTNLTGIVTSITAGSGISVDQSTGNITITSLGGAGDLYYRLDSDVTGSNVTTAQSILGVGVSLSTNTVYEFEGFAIYTRASGTTSHNFRQSFGGTATINNMSVQYQSSVYTGTIPDFASNTFVGVQTGTDVVTVVSAIAGAPRVITVLTTGSVSINQAGTFIPQYVLSAAPGAGYTTKAGSYFRFKPIGSSGSNSSSGTWS